MDTREKTPAAKETQAPNGHSRRWLRYLSLPRAILGLTGAAVISGVVAHYLPGVLPAEAKGPAVLTNVLDNTNPPLRIMLPEAPTSLHTRPSPGCASFRPWALGVGGADANETALDLVVQGNTSAPVYVAGLRARILSAVPPRSGVLAVCPSAGTVTPRKIAISLDGGLAGKYITHAGDEPFGFTVGKGETEVFDIGATTHRSDVRWLLELDLVVAGRQRVITISDNGRPFQTTAVGTRRPTVYTWNLQDAWQLTR